MNAHKKDSIGQAFCYGFWDRQTFDYAVYRENAGCLYSCWRRRIAWHAGWSIANFLTDRPLREIPQVRPFIGDQPRS